MLEPADSQEAKDFTILALELSEKFDTPVLLRTTTRISHSKSVVELGERQEVPLRPYNKAFQKNVLLPSTARLRHPVVEERMQRLEEAANSLSINRIEWGDRSLGIIAAGVAYQYAREAFPQASFLKLGMTHPLPKKLIREFADGVEELLVVEELDPILEEQIRAMGIDVRGKDAIPIIGELNPDLVAESLNGKRPVPALKDVDLPARPPVLCPGCSHRGVFWALKKLRLIVHGDIGCYTLAAIPPLESMDTCLNMGASIGMAEGMVKVAPEKFQNKVVGIIGDSTFIHSGITPLIDMVYNKGYATVIILDNRTTAMTGHQEHPGTGIRLSGEPSTRIDIEQLCRSIGVEHVRKVDPYDLDSMIRVIREEVKRPEPSVIIADAPCVIHDRIVMDEPYIVLDELCVECDLCYKIGCPALFPGDDGKPDIDPLLCIGCSHCAQVCNLDAIQLPKEKVTVE
jgi:indolepyruvate ferredoxin oxidoreductase alpha subunit